MIIGGEFTGYNDTGRNRIARVFGGELLATPDLLTSQISLFPNPTTGRFTIDLCGLSAAEPALVDVR